MAKYRKKPVVIEAIENDGHWRTIIDWLDGMAAGQLIFQPGSSPPITRNMDGTLNITTLEGTIHASVGDWIIRGIKGEFYPCKPDIFEATYEPVSAAEVATDE